MAKITKRKRPSSSTYTSTQRQLPRKQVSNQQTQVQRSSHVAVRRTSKSNKPKRRRSYKSITVITFVMLTIYLLGYVVVFMNKSSVGVETVNYGTIDAPTTLNGIIVRDEAVFKSNMEGQPYYNFSDNEKVKKGAVVCNVKNVASTDVIEGQIENIDRDILQVQKSRSDISVFQEDITAIEDSIKQTVEAYIYKFNGNNISDVYSLKSQIQTQISRRNSIWLTENTKSLTELAATRGQYEEQLAGSMSSVTTDCSGIVSFNIDGLEEKLTYETIKDITEEQTKMKAENNFISKSKPIHSGDPVFKIVKSNVWYIASYVNNKVASQWAINDSKVIHTTVNEEERSVSAVIESMDIGSKNTFVVFKTDKNIIDFMDLRTMEFRIMSDTFNGIKIPNGAIVEKTLLKIPTNSIIESEDDKGIIKGVLKRVDNTDKFTEVDIAKNDDDGQFSYIVQNNASVNIGDTVITGSGAEALEYKVSEVVTYKGVLVANSSIAKFVVVDIIGQNTDYSIVSAGTGPNDLKVYDNIVSDAKNVEENAEVY